jgi:TusA-related sulfurtransferase
MTFSGPAGATGLAAAIVARHRPSLEALLHPDVRLRALLPSRSVDIAGAGAVAAELVGWFDEVPDVSMLMTTVEPVGDVWHVGYRLGLHGLKAELVTEQHVYLTLRDGAIDGMQLLCSGFRPASVRRVRPTEAEEEPNMAVKVPVEHGRIDALGVGCAGLTPQIAAAIRALRPGQVLSVLTDDPSAPADIAAWSRLTGHAIVATATEAGGTRYYLRRS